MTKKQSETSQASSFFDRIASGEEKFLSQLDRNAKTLLQSALTRLDVVNREEFDAQAAVLKRTRERLEILEAQIEALTIELEAAPQKGD
jgi:BMFP domain-containing protein YqiC